MNGRSNSNFEWEQICFGSRFRMINDPPFARLNEYMARNETLETSILSTRENRPRTEAPPPPMINDDLSATVNAGTHAIRNAYPLQPSHVSKTFSINNPRVSHTHDAFFLSRGLMRCRVGGLRLFPDSPFSSPLPLD